MPTAVIVDAIRTPIGRRNGQLSGWHPVDLAAHVLSTLVLRHDLDPAVVDDVIMGCVSQVGEQALNIGRNALLAAGFPDTVPGTTVDRQCGSSQQAIHFAAQGVIAGAYDVVIAAGIESMSRVPMGSSVLGADPFGARLVERYPDLVPQGISAELIAEQWKLSREELDEFALGSQLRAARATAEARFDREIVPVPVVVDGVTRGDDRRRGHPARHDRGTSRRAQAGVQGRWGRDRGELIADQRRRGRGAHHQ